MAHVILGLLLIAPMSLYDLIKAFDQGISLFYSASSGSIKRALDGLLAKGHIEIVSVDKGSRGRKTYGVTPAGKDAFRTWMNGPIEESNLDTAALSRIHFLGHLPADERLQILERVRTRIESDLVTLEQVESVASATEYPEHMSELVRYGRATLDYGLMANRAALEWVEDFLRRERESTGKL